MQALEARFQDRPGLSKIGRKEYVLREDATGREITTSLDIRKAILPGQKIVQDVIFRHDVDEDDRKEENTCPFCHSLNMEADNASVLW
jgi:hypothetical protein